MVMVTDKKNISKTFNNRNRREKKNPRTDIREPIYNRGLNRTCPELTCAEAMQNGLINDEWKDKHLQE
jgi:hypothetical protein